MTSKTPPANDLTAIKAMLFEALNAQRDNFCRLVLVEPDDDPDSVDHPYISIKGEIDVDKLAATVADFFAAQQSATKEQGMYWMNLALEYRAKLSAATSPTPALTPGEWTLDQWREHYRVRMTPENLADDLHLWLAKQSFEPPEPSTEPPAPAAAADRGDGQ